MCEHDLCLRRYDELCGGKRSFGSQKFQTPPVTLDCDSPPPGALLIFLGKIKTLKGRDKERELCAFDAFDKPIHAR